MSLINKCHNRILDKVRMNNKKVFYVCSYGGCGSKMLCEYLAHFGTIKHVHSRNPPNKLTQIGTLELKEQGKEPSFDNLKFKETQCKKVLPGFDEIKENPSVANSVLNQYNIIANNLAKLIEDIVNLLNKIIDFKLFMTENRIKLR